MDESEQRVLAEVCSTLRNWKVSATVNAIFHYVLGIAAVVLAPLAASEVIADTKTRLVLGIIAGACSGLMGFLQGKELSNRFWDAHGSLTEAWLEYIAMAPRLTNQQRSEGLVRLSHAISTAQRMLRPTSQTTSAAQSVSATPPNVAPAAGNGEHSPAHPAAPAVADDNSPKVS